MLADDVKPVYICDKPVRAEVAYGWSGKARVSMGYELKTWHSEGASYLCICRKKGVRETQLMQTLRGRNTLDVLFLDPQGDLKGCDKVNNVEDSLRKSQRHALVSWFPRTAIIKYHNPGGSHNRNVFSHLSSD